MSSTEDRDPACVLISGGGIVGLCLAMAIKKQLNITPEVYEKTSTFSREVGAGLNMYPNGLRVLRDISPDLLASVRNAGHPFSRRCWERHDGTEIMSADESVLSDYESELTPIGIRRSRLQKVLYNHAVSMGIQVHFSKALKSATALEQQHRQEGLIRVEFVDGTTRHTQVFFGADGSTGVSRSIVVENEPISRLEYTGVTCLMGLAQCPANGICFPTSTHKDDFHAVFFPTGPQEQCFQFHIKEAINDHSNSGGNNRSQWGNLSPQVARAECDKILESLKLEGWHQKYIEPLEKMSHAVRVGYFVLEPSLKNWVRGRIVLVGDAAHPPVPYIGQGAQQGLEDAGVVVSLMKIYCRNDNGDLDLTNFEEAMKLYQDIRIQRSSQILEFSKSVGELQQKRAGTEEARFTDTVLKGEVLMHGTLPILFSGAGHDYKEDVRQATQAMDLPKTKTEATLKALKSLLGMEDRMYSTKSPSLALAHSCLETPNNTRSLSLANGLSTERIERLANWLAEGLEEQLKRIVAHNSTSTRSLQLDENKVVKSWSENGKRIVDEVSEVIELPAIEKERVVAEQNSQSKVSLPRKVTKQIRAFVKAIAQLYRRDNPFHNFEHACNVAVSVSRFLSRMETEKGATLTLNDRTYGIASDPLTQFACVLAALLHDAEHQGVPNAQLLKEHPKMAEYYKNRSIAEQHSVDIAFEILLDSKYDDLRFTIYRDEEEMQRFRKLIVNIVMATDICDKDLKAFRTSRWNKAFASKTRGVNGRETDNLKATIGIEHLIQASDVSHTMQPWRVYRSWNERLFAEMYKAYREGRAEKDPSQFWYEGEIGFFDFYIIPLAKELLQCQVFGSASYECLHFATTNRAQWVANGAKEVKKMIEKMKKAADCTSHSTLQGLELKTKDQQNQFKRRKIDSVAS